MGERAEQGVGEGMQGHIGVGMAFQAVRVRDGKAAQPDMICRTEAMDVKAQAGANLGQRCTGSVGHGQILSRREFAILLAPRHQRHRQSRPLGDRGIVAHVGVPRGRRRAMRGQDSANEILAVFVHAKGRHGRWMRQPARAHRPVSANPSRAPPPWRRGCATRPQAHGR